MGTGDSLLFWVLGVVFYCIHSAVVSSPGLVAAFGSSLAMAAAPRARRWVLALGLVCAGLGGLVWLLVRLFGCGGPGDAPPLVYVTGADALPWAGSMLVAGCVSALAAWVWLRRSPDRPPPSPGRQACLVVAAGLLCVGAVVVLVASGRGPVLMYLDWGQHTFDSQAWQNPGTDDLANPRGPMLRDYIRNHRPIGRHRREIERELGECDMMNSAFQAGYNLGLPGFSMDIEELLLWFDTSDRCIGWCTLQH